MGKQTYYFPSSFIRNNQADKQVIMMLGHFYSVVRINLLLIFLVVLCACSTKPYANKSQEMFSGTGSNGVYVVSHGRHTGLVVPTKDILMKIPKLKNRFGSSQYIEFGWGDMAFYQAKEKTSGLTMKAIFWPTESVVYVVPVFQNPYVFVPNLEVERLCLSDSQLSSLIAFIGNSFYKGTKGEILELNSGLFGYSQFYKGVGDYYLMNTCNNWTAKGLQSAGMNISPTFKLTADSVMNYVKALNRVQMNKGNLCEKIES